MKFKTHYNDFHSQHDFTLRWRHNGRDGVSTLQPHDCLLNRSFRRRSKKTSKLRVTGLCVGNSAGPVNSPHKWPVTRKMFSFDDVIVNVFNATPFFPSLARETPHYIIVMTYGRGIYIVNADVCTHEIITSNGSWCIGIKGEMSGTVCVTFTWDIYIYIYELFIAFVCFVVCSLL